MTHPAKLLRELLQKAAPPSSGIVQSVSQTTAFVRTREGIAEYPSNGIPLAPGQRVALSSAGVTGVMRYSDPIEVYDV